MMWIRILFMLCLITKVFDGTVNAQIRIVGKVLELESFDPVAFANIGIKNSTVGCASFEDGTFYLEIDQKRKNDSLLFSSLGYQDTAHIISDLTGDSCTVYLKSMSYALKEVVISGNYTEENIGGLKKAKQSGIQFSNREGGAAMAILLNEDGEEWLLSSASVFIHENELDTFLLKCRIMSTKDGKPFKDLLKENVIVKSTIRKGEIDISLSDHKLYVNEPFFLVFEWILSKSTANYYRSIAHHRPEWWPKGTSIHNRKFIVYYNEDGKVTKKVKLTREQREEYEIIRHRTTAFSIRKSDFKTFYRESSMSSWEPFRESLVANVKYLSREKK